MMSLAVDSNSCGVGSDAGLRWSDVLCLYVVGLSSCRGVVVAHWNVGCRFFPGVGNCCGVPLQCLISLDRGRGRVARGRGPVSLLGASEAEKLHHISNQMMFYMMLS